MGIITEVGENNVGARGIQREGRGREQIKIELAHLRWEPRSATCAVDEDINETPAIIVLTRLSSVEKECTQVVLPLVRVECSGDTRNKSLQPQHHPLLGIRTTWPDWHQSSEKMLLDTLNLKMSCLKPAPYKRSWLMPPAAMAIRWRSSGHSSTHRRSFLLGLLLHLVNSLLLYKMLLGY